MTLWINMLVRVTDASHKQRKRRLQVKFMHKHTCKYIPLNRTNWKLSRSEKYFTHFCTDHKQCYFLGVCKVFCCCCLCFICVLFDFQLSFCFAFFSPCLLFPPVFWPYPNRLQDANRDSREGLKQSQSISPKCPTAGPGDTNGVSLAFFPELFKALYVETQTIKSYLQRR